MSGKPIPAEKMPRVIGRYPHVDAENDPLGLYRPDAVIEYAVKDGPPPDPHQPYTTSDRIKAYLRSLTHREMRELAAELFSAYERAHPQTEPTVLKAAIPREALAEVIDRFAHDD